MKVSEVVAELRNKQHMDEDVVTVEYSLPVGSTAAHRRLFGFESQRQSLFKIVYIGH